MALLARKLPALEANGEPAPLVPAGPTQLAALAQASALARAALPDEHRALERAKFGQLVDSTRERHGLSIPVAVEFVRASRHQRFPILSCGGRSGRSALTLANYRHWADLVRDPRTRKPDWSNVAALVNAYPRGLRGSRMNVEYRKRIMQYALCGNHIDLAAAHRRVEAEVRIENGGQLSADFGTYRQLRHYFQTQVSPVIRLRAGLGAKEWRDKTAPWILRTWEGVEPGEVFFMDHRQLDCWVKYPDPTGEEEFIAVRPFITGCQDARSLYFPCLHVYADQHPNSDVILETVAKAILATGFPPATFYTDRGLDFLSKGLFAPAVLQDERGKEHAHCVAFQLGCDVEKAAPYNGREKPIERSFRDVATGFDKFLRGYCGNRPGTRPENAEAARRNPHALMSERELWGQLQHWLASDWHVRKTRSRITGGRPPAEVWETRKPSSAPLSAGALVLALLRPQKEHRVVSRGPAQVGGYSVRFDGGLYGDPVLREHLGRRVMVKTWMHEKKVAFGGKELPEAVYAFELNNRPIGRLELARPVAALAKTPEEKELLRQACIARQKWTRDNTDEIEVHTGRRRLLGPMGIALPETWERPRLGDTVSTPLHQAPGRGRKLAGKQKRELSAHSDGYATGADAVDDLIPPEYSIDNLPEAERRRLEDVAKGRKLPPEARNPHRDLDDLIGPPGLGPATGFLTDPFQEEDWLGEGIA